MVIPVRAKITVPINYSEEGEDGEDEELCEEEDEETSGKEDRGEDGDPT